MNSTNLVGRITKQLELKSTTGGVAFVRFTLAVNRSFTNSNGEKEADFINCVAWRKTAESLVQFMGKGSQIGVTGRIQTSSFDGKDGNKVFMTEVVADGIEFLEPKKNDSPQQQNSGQQYSQQPNQQQQNIHQQNQGGYQNQQQSNNQQQNYNQQGQGYNQSQPSYANAGANSGFQVSDDDLPF